MKRINLTKYGFIRWPEEDFSDDGNRFTCYRAGKSVRVSKLVSNGQVYLSTDGSCGKGTLPYAIYSKLPNYRKSNWEYNGVSAEALTDADLKAFYQSCLDYEKEYEAVEERLTRSITMRSITYKYAVGDVVRFKDTYPPSSSAELHKFVGKTAVVVKRADYNGPCYKLEGIEAFIRERCLLPCD